MIKVALESPKAQIPVEVSLNIEMCLQPQTAEAGRQFSHTEEGGRESSRVYFVGGFLVVVG